MKNARAHMREHGKRSYNLDGWDGKSGLLTATLNLKYTFDCEQCAADFELRYGDVKTHWEDQNVERLCRNVRRHMQEHVEKGRIAGFEDPKPDESMRVVTSKRELHRYIEY